MGPRSAELRRRSPRLRPRLDDEQLPLHTVPESDESEGAGVFRAATSTWGIGGTQFLVLYLVLGAASFGAMWAWRQRLVGSGHLMEKLHLDECELAMPNGGIKLAMTAAAVRLRETGVLVPQGRGRVEVAHRPKSHATALEAELYEALLSKPDAVMWKVSRKVARGSAARRLRQDLAAKGLMLGPRQERQARWSWLAALALLALGIARVVAGLASHKSIGDLSVLVLLVVIVTVMAAREPSVATRVGQVALGNEQTKRRKWRSAGDIRASMAVALFGRAVLWRIDPAFAKSWRVTRPGLGNWRDAYQRERPAGWVDGGFIGGGFGDGGGG